MGVIDLNARVTALEKNSGNSQEIDQIEADLTALEETVGGLIEDVTAKFTPNAGITFAADNPKVSIVKIGNICFMEIKATMSAGYAAAGSNTTIGTLDTSIRPANSVSVFCLGESSAARQGSVNTDGTVISNGGNWFSMEAFWKIATA